MFHGKPPAIEGGECQVVRSILETLDNLARVTALDAADARPDLRTQLGSPAHQRVPR